MAWLARGGRLLLCRRASRLLRVSAMRVLLVALAATSALAASAASVSCVPGTYYWGTLKTKHYCVKCPASWTSKGCSNCLPDPKGSMCFKPDSACTRGMFVLPATKSNTDKCEKCAEGEERETRA